MLVPVLGLVQVGIQAHADRYIYLPQIGLAIALVFFASGELRARPGLRAPVAAAAGLALVALALTATRQVETFRDSDHAADPRRGRDRGQPARALPARRRAPASRPAARGRARAEQRARALAPWHVKIRIALADVLAQGGRIPEAIRQYRQRPRRRSERARAAARGAARQRRRAGRRGLRRSGRPACARFGPSFEPRAPRAEVNLLASRFHAEPAAAARPGRAPGRTLPRGGRPRVRGRRHRAHLARIRRPRARGDRARAPGRGLPRARSPALPGARESPALGRARREAADPRPAARGAGREPDAGGLSEEAGRGAGREAGRGAARGGPRGRSPRDPGLTCATATCA